MKNNIIIELLVVYFLCTQNTIAREIKSAPIKKGMLFSSAHKSLTKAGWRPRPMHVKSEYTYIGTENVLIKQGVKGIQSCAVDGLSLCIINYENYQHCLRVITTGEDIKHLRIDNWDRKCPPDDAL